MSVRVQDTVPMSCSEAWDYMIPVIEELIRKFVAYLSVRGVQHEQEQNDIIQDLCLQLHRQLTTHGAPTFCENYCFAILRNLTSSRFRRQYRWQSSGQDECEMDPVDLLQQERRETDELMEGLVSTLVSTFGRTAGKGSSLDLKLALALFEAACEGPLNILQLSRQYSVSYSRVQKLWGRVRFTIVRYLTDLGLTDREKEGQI